MVRLAAWHPSVADGGEQAVGSAAVEKHSDASHSFAVMPCACQRFLKASDFFSSTARLSFLVVLVLD